MPKIKKTKKEPTSKAVTGKEVEEDVICVYKSEIVRFLRFGRELKITPKAHCSINKPGFKIEFFSPAVNVLIGIGNDHVAHLVMDLHAWEALVKGAEVHITTTKEFNEDSIDELINTKTK